jgi:phosphoglycolate phosphatase
MRPSVVLFDLDGTLSDSAPGILSSLRFAFREHGLPPLDPATERALLGPPFYDSLPPLIGTDMLWPVIESYRARYAEAMYESTAFAGVRDLLVELRSDGRRLAVATSKPEHFAVPIVEHLGLTDFFETVGGDDLDGTRRTKSLVIGNVLARLGNPAPDHVVMVGDRSHDVNGAREHGMAAIGVRWGYALAGELEAARPVAICTTPAEVGAELGIGDDARAS